MKLKWFALLLTGIVLLNTPVFAAEKTTSSQPSEEAMKALREQLSENAAFIRKVNSDASMNDEQKRAAIKEFIQSQNEKHA